MAVFEKKNENRSLDEMDSRDKADMIRRLEREREKINLEIEGILSSYAKESGNRTLKKRRRATGEFLNDFDFDRDEEI